jgi:hypothetical protein
LRKHPDIHSLCQIDEAVNRIAPKSMPPTPALAMPDKDLGDPTLSRKID